MSLRTSMAEAASRTSAGEATLYPLWVRPRVRGALHCTYVLTLHFMIDTAGLLFLYAPSACRDRCTLDMVHTTTLSLTVGVRGTLCTALHKEHPHACNMPCGEAAGTDGGGVT